MTVKPAHPACAPTAVLVDVLETQHNSGQPLDPEVVFILTGRLTSISRTLIGAIDIVSGHHQRARCDR